LCCCAAWACLLIAWHCHQGQEHQGRYPHHLQRSPRQHQEACNRRKGKALRMLCKCKMSSSRPCEKSFNESHASWKSPFFLVLQVSPRADEEAAVRRRKTQCVPLFSDWRVACWTVPIWTLCLTWYFPASRGSITSIVQNSATREVIKSTECQPCLHQERGRESGWGVEGGWESQADSEAIRNR
jgi:hypothetical protein